MKPLAPALLLLLLAVSACRSGGPPADAPVPATAPTTPAARREAAGDEEAPTFDIRPYVMACAPRAASEDARSALREHGRVLFSGTLEETSVIVLDARTVVEARELLAPLRGAAAGEGVWEIWPWWATSNLVRLPDLEGG